MCASAGVALFALSALVFGYAHPPAAHAAINGKSLASPIRLTVPAARIDSPIVPVGLNHKGEMAVPSGKTKEVGWWKKGAVPGERGTAVLDAHVFAAFSSLSKVAPGDSIYVHFSDGTRKRFVVDRTRTYDITSLDTSTLFDSNDDRALHLITCAGELTHDGSTYTKRLIVFASYAGSA